MIVERKRFKNPSKTSYWLKGLKSKNIFSKILHIQDLTYFIIIIICSTLYLPFCWADSQPFFPFLKLKYAPSYLSASGQITPSAKFAHHCPFSTNFPSVLHIHLASPSYTLEFIFSINSTQQPSLTLNLCLIPSD